MTHLMARWPVEVQLSAHGRCCVLTEAVGAGDVVLSCVPYAVAVEADWLESVCLGCASVSKTPLPLRCEVRLAPTKP